MSPGCCEGSSNVSWSVASSVRFGVGPDACEIPEVDHEARVVEFANGDDVQVPPSSSWGRGVFGLGERGAKN